MSFIVGYETWEIVGLNESLEVTKFGFQWVYEIVAINENKWKTIW